MGKERSIDGGVFEHTALFKRDLFVVSFYFMLMMAASVIIAIFTTEFLFYKLLGLQNEALGSLFLGILFTLALVAFVLYNPDINFFKRWLAYWDRNVRGYTYWVHRFDGVLHADISRGNRYPPECNDQPCFGTNGRTLYMGIKLGGWLGRSRCLELVTRSGMLQEEVTNGVSKWIPQYMPKRFAANGSIRLIDVEGASSTFWIIDAFKMLEEFQMGVSVAVTYGVINGRFLERWADWEGAASLLPPHYESVSYFDSSFSLEEAVKSTLQDVNHYRDKVTEMNIAQQGHLRRTLKVARALADTSRLGKSPHGRALRLDILRSAALMDPDATQAEQIQREIEDIKERIAKAEKRARAQAKRKAKAAS